MDKELAIIILTKNNPQLLETCITSILKHTYTTDYKLYIGDTGSDPATLGIMVNILKKLLDANSCKLLQLDQYHFGKNYNDMIKHHVDEEWLLMCNDDIELQSNCIDPMLSHAKHHEHVGSVGCRLLFPNNTLQHAGQTACVDQHGMLQCTHRGYKQTGQFQSGPVVGNTAAFMLTRKKTFNDVAGFDEMFTECWEDIHLNMKYILSGYNNWYMDDVHAIHHESVTRTKTDQALYRLRFDYTYKLKPWFDQLSVDNQQKLLSYN